MKKAISYLSGELLDELFVKVMFSDKELDDKKVGEIAARILSGGDELISRISHRHLGDKKAVKAHFASIRADWDKLVGDVWTEIEAL